MSCRELSPRGQRRSSPPTGGGLALPRCPSAVSGDVVPKTGEPRAAAFGPERWSTAAGAEWSWFDLWFCVLAVADFGGDLDRVEVDLAGRLNAPPWTGVSGYDVEAKLSHLADLVSRVAAAGTTAEALATLGKGPGVLSRARSTILKKSVTGSSMTPAMRVTPRVALDRRARIGHWSSFPVNPASWYDKFRRTVEVDDFISERRTFGLTSDLSDRLSRYATTCTTAAERLALHRAFHTAGLELADRSDDGMGCVGDMRVEAFEEYLDVDWIEAGIGVDIYWQDLCELLVWEPFSLTYRNQTLPFRHAEPAHADLIEGILLGLADEHRSAHLGFHADEAERSSHGSTSPPAGTAGTPPSRRGSARTGRHR